MLTLWLTLKAMPTVVANNPTTRNFPKKNEKYLLEHGKSAETGDEIMINRHIETALATAHVRAESARQWASETDRHLASMLNRSQTLVELLRNSKL